LQPKQIFLINPDFLITYLPISNNKLNHIIFSKISKMSSRGHSQDRALSQERETPFAGYGDRVGSGVAYAPVLWKGGEQVTDPSLVTKSLKTRRFYYSPIGDGMFLG
jgi:hypothetical protein